MTSLSSAMPESSLSLPPRAFPLAPLLLLLAACCAFLALLPPHYIAFTSFFLNLQLNNWSTCFFSNTITAHFFLQSHLAHFGPNPTRISATPVASIPSHNYSYQALKTASKDFTEPVVVRGLFKDTPAMHWAAGLQEAAADRDALQWNGTNEAGGTSTNEAGTTAFSLLDRFNVSVVQNSTLGKDHWINCGQHVAADTIMTNFGAAVAQIVASDPWDDMPSQTLILPPASRTHREVDVELDETFNRLVERDLDLQRMGGGGWDRKGVFNAGENASEKATGQNALLERTPHTPCEQRRRFVSENRHKHIVNKGGAL